jgi:hypothetical protein
MCDCKAWPSAGLNFLTSAVSLPLADSRNTAAINTRIRNLRTFSAFTMSIGTDSPVLLAPKREGVDAYKNADAEFKT